MRLGSTLILFTKTPQICRVKTRMWPDLSHRECLNLHKKLTAHAINQFKLCAEFKLIIYTTHIDKIRHLYPRGIIIKQQSGLGLGMRMYNAINQELKNAQRVVLVGSDCLALDINYVSTAFKAITAANDVVLGPTLDGGYALIGMQKPHTYLFNNMSWGTSNVFNQTQSSAFKHGCKIKALDKISDVDTVEDLHHLKKINTLPEWANNLVRNIGD